ncbi:MAG TPA: DUF2125 domain-containing protein [Xanthobacteraceae bacterium]
MREASAGRGRRSLIWIPLALVLLLAGAWTGLWFYAAHRAEATVATWIEREAQAGRIYTCASRSVRGYPFRIEMRCSEPRAEVRLRSEPAVFQAREMLAVAQIYQPDRVIAEISGPMTIRAATTGDYVADWKLLQASVRGLPRAAERISLVFDEPVLRAADMPADRSIASAKRAELHVRQAPGPDGAAPVFELSARLATAVLGGIPALAQRPFEAEADAILRGITDLSSKPLPERLREWQAAGGRIELTRARVQQADALAVARGELGLTPQGRLDGTIALTMAGLDQVMAALFGGQGRTQAGLLAGLSLLSRAELEGKRALAVPLRFRDGTALLGPVPLGQIGPLF